MTRNSPLRIGVVSCGPALRGWHLRCLDDLVADGHAELAVHIIQPTTDDDPAVWNIYARHMLERRAPGLRVDRARSATLGVPRIALDERSEPPDEASQRTLEAAALDLVIRFGSGPVPGWLAQLPRHGTWTYSHGDLFDLDGAPAASREVLDARPTTTVRLVRLGPDGRSGRVFHSGEFRVYPRSHGLSLALICEGISDWLTKACRAVADGWSDEDSDTIAVRAPERKQPEPIVRLAAVQMVRELARLVHGAVRQEQWHIGVVDAPIEAFITSGAPVPAPRWLRGLSHTHYLADPFGVHDEQGLVVMAERYDYLTRRGRIVAISERRGPGGRRTTAIDLDGHASYPFLVSDDDAIFCVPENNTTGSVQLYRSVRFPDRWSHVTDLVVGVRPVDPTVIRHANRWWLFFTDEERAVDTNLYVWHADELEGPWRPHRANPVKTDVSSARPGGTPFVHRGSLYRPAQDCTTRYGAAIAVNEVTDLTTDSFGERTVTRVHPDPAGRFPTGLHTLASAGSRTLIDGRRDAFLPLSIVGRLTRLVPRTLRRRRRAAV